VAAVTNNMEERDEFLADIHYRLEKAQVTQKLRYNKVQHHVEYQVGNWALLCHGSVWRPRFPRLSSASSSHAYSGHTASLS